MKRFSGVCGFVLCTASLMASTPESATYSSRDISEKLTPDTKESVLYNKGYKDGYEIGKRAGYELAMRDAKKKLLSYKKKIEAYEVGKYLTLKGKATPPRFYQTRDQNGQINIVMKGCEIRGQLTPEDILMMPTLEESATSTPSTTIQYKSKNTGYSDSVFVAGADSQTPIARPSSSMVQTTTRVFEDTQFYRKLLTLSGILFTIEPSGGGLQATFHSPQEADNFIRANGLKYSRDYK